MLLIVAIGLSGGIAVGTHSPIVSAMSQRVGGASSSLISHTAGMLGSLALLISRRGERIHDWHELSWYMWGCGLLGIVLILTVSHTMPKIGATAAVTLIIVGQLLAGMVIDHFGAFGTPIRSVDLTRIGASLLLVAGAYLMIR